MNAVVNIPDKLFGFFELDTAGTVLYSRTTCDSNHSVFLDLNGRNFFEELVKFENREEFRRLVNHFVDSETQADSFTFTCCCDEGLMPIRVLLARLRALRDGEQKTLTLLHIRRAD